MKTSDTIYRGETGRGEPYRDWRILSDDLAVLKNPHKGWYWHYVDQSTRKNFNYRENHPKGDYCEDFTGLNHLYLRFDWGDIERSEGVYDWSYLDAIIDEWGPKGYTFSLRMCTYENWDTDATPYWVFGLGAKFTPAKAGGHREPVYDDPIYLEKLENFMAEYARKFDGDPRIEYVDVGTYGTWGEGHTYCGSEIVYPAEAKIKHINLHLKYFKNTFVLVNDDMINEPNADKSSWEEREKLAKYCLGKGLGLRDDSVYCYSGYNYESLRTAELYPAFAKNAPVDLESEHMTSFWADGRARGYLPFIEACKTAQATFAGFHGYPRLFLKEYKYVADYCANRLGYWYFLEGMTLPECVSGLPTEAALYIGNRGWAPAYHIYTLKITAVSEEGKCYPLSSVSPDNRQWLPGGVTATRVRLDFSGVPEGSYGLRIGLFDGGRPIKLALKGNCLCADGSYEVDQIDVVSMI